MYIAIAFYIVAGVFLLAAFIQWAESEDNHKKYKPTMLYFAVAALFTAATIMQITQG